MAVFLPSDTSTIRYEETDLASLHSRPSHFVVAVRFNSDKVARGEGRSKKMAEQHAAREALKLLGVIKEK